MSGQIGGRFRARRSQLILQHKRPDPQSLSVPGLQEVGLKGCQFVRLDQGINPHRIEGRQIMGQAFHSASTGTQVGGTAESKFLKCLGQWL